MSHTLFLSRGKFAHYNYRHHHRYLRKLTRTLVHHKHHNAGNANTDRESTGVFRDSRCKKETHSLLRTQPTSRSRPADQELVTVHVELVATSADNLSHRRVDEQASNKSRLARYVHVSRQMAYIPTLLRLRLHSAGVHTATVSQEPLRNIQTA